MIFYRMNNREQKTRIGSWIVKNEEKIWGEPQFFVDAYCLTTREFRTFYFTTEGSEKTSKDIAQMEFDKGVFSKPVTLPGELNSNAWEAHAHPSPDGSYILFDRVESTFVSFYQDDGTWSKGYDLGRKLHVPCVSPGGRFIFFEADGDIWWVDAKIIDEIKPDKLK